MIILGIDPGISITGFGVIEIIKNKPRCLGFGGIRNRAKDAPLAERLGVIYDGLCEVVEKYQPKHCAVEEVFYHENVRTAIVMGHARGIAMLAAQQSGVEVYEYSAREVKMSTVGSGAASKQQVQAMVTRILNTEKPPKPQDAADALAAAICHFHRIRFLLMKTARRQG
ncbi:MAG: crossover junction endodeoxyribonuclease RuvC [Calditrichia bacterium]